MWCVNMNKLVSIIIPVYNAEQNLDKCLQSVTAQIYKKIEIILVDDGSTDNSGKLCNEWAKKDKRVKVIHQSNGGTSFARNTGLKKTSGKYITFVDNDDVVSEKLIWHLVDILEQNNGDISICNPIHVRPKHDKKNYKDSTRVDLLTSTEAICNLFYQNKFLPTVWCKLFKKELFNNVCFPNGKLFEDNAVLYKLFANAKRIVYSDAKYYKWIHYKSSITGKNYNGRIADILDVCDEQIKFAKTQNDRILEAAQFFLVIGSLRVWLNLPKTFETESIINQCESNIDFYHKKVVKNKNCHYKLKIALFLYKNFPFMLKNIYVTLYRKNWYYLFR